MASRRRLHAALRRIQANLTQIARSPGVAVPDAPDASFEPTNNTAERALRPAVIYRKLSFGTQSASGSRYLERLLSVSETCRLQNRNAYQYLVAAMEAKFAEQPAPSLLPADTNPMATAA